MTHHPDFPFLIPLEPLYRERRKRLWLLALKSFLVSFTLSSGAVAWLLH